MENVQLFLDYANIQSIARQLNYVIDYKVLLNDILVSVDEGRFLTGAVAYVPKDPRSEHSRDREIEALWNSGFLVHSKVGTIAGNSYKCDFDVEISMDIMKVAHTSKPDIIVIVSGDSDFVPLIKELRQMSIRVEVASFRNNLSRHLQQVASGVIFLEEYFENNYDVDENDNETDNINDNDDDLDNSDSTFDPYGDNKNINNDDDDEVYPYRRK